ncbi:hypothetical protein Vretimale_16027 [Volvox reticuliferus]|uniref:Uncharacterized protein n=1 Tax=Volvox reticuliferus TaxID=1737510 RepID=A0A8J4FKV7_9CHLO|nr:hypothetical protein Vretifemale_9652 [Volvox reticuliferus]GIM12790.1 hypothetical protein Vretimale_16027 [Volvox reticuliferus]
MRPLTFDQAWINNGRKLTSAKVSSGRVVSSSDDDYPSSYHNYLTSDRSDLHDDKASRIRYHRSKDVSPPGRTSARAAIKGIEAHAKSKGSLVSFAKQHRITVDTMLSNLSPSDVLSASKSVRSSKTTTSVSSPRTLSRSTHAPSASWSSDESDSDFHLHGDDRSGGLRTGGGSLRCSHSSSAAQVGTKGGCAARSQACSHQLAGICNCGACSSRTERPAAAALAGAAAGIAARNGGQGNGAKGRAIADAQLVAAIERRSAGGRSDGPLREAQLLSLRAKPPFSPSNFDDLPTPRMAWYSYLSPRQITGRKGSASAAFPSAASAVPLSVGGPQMRRNFSSGSDGDSDSSRSRAMRCFGSLISGTEENDEAAAWQTNLQMKQLSSPRGEGASGAGRAAISTMGTEPLSTGHGGRAVAACGPYGRRLASDLSTSADDSEHEEEQAVQQMLGGTTAWVQQRQQQRQQQQELAALRQAARQRALAAILRESKEAFGGDGRSTGSLRGTGSSATASAADLNVGASFTSWVGRNSARRGSAGAANVSRLLALSAPTSLAQHRLHSSPGGSGGKSDAGHTCLAISARESHEVARKLLWRDAEALVAGATFRRHARSLGRSSRIRATIARALSDSSEESFAYRMTTAAITLRSASAPRYGSRAYDSARERQKEQQRRLGRSLAARHGTVPKNTAPDSAAGSVVSSAGEFGRFNGDHGNKARTWLMTDVLCTPVGGHLGAETPTRGCDPPVASPQWTGSPWTQSPSQKLPLSHVWGPACQGSDEGGTHGAGIMNVITGSPLSAASDDLLWRPPLRPLSKPGVSMMPRSPPARYHQPGTAATGAATASSSASEILATGYGRYKGRNESKSNTNRRFCCF